jgi:ABC-type branched-subunit amino acid transport system ATPase component/branched-subunit amino acid ABC-type transport system permease component
MLNVLISGLVTGALYALTTIAIVIVYKSSRIANFALGGFSSLAVYLAFEVSGAEVPWVVLLVIAVVAGAIAGALTQGVILLLGKADLQAYVVSTFALFLITQGLILLVWGADNKNIPAPWGVSEGWHVGGVLISYANVLYVVVALIITVALHLVVQRTRFGLAVRMSSSGPMTAQLLGLKVPTVRFWTWVIGGGLGGLAALLISPRLTLSPSGFTSFMMVALVALVLGGFTNIPGAALGGFLLGVSLNLLSYWLTAELTETYLFFIIAILLFVKPDGVLGSRDGRVPEPSIPSGRFSRFRRTAPRKSGKQPAIAEPVGTAPRLRELPRPVLGLRATLALAGAVVLVVLPFIAPLEIVVLLPQLTATYVAVLGMNIIVGYSGQLSVGQSAIMAFGAYTGAIFFVHLGVPPLLMLPLGCIGGLVIGFLVGLPAVRLGPLFLTLFTLVLAFAVPEVISYFSDLTGGTQGLPLAVPEFLFSQQNQYWIGAGIAVVATVVVYLMRRATVGRRWVAVRDSAAGAQSVGVNPATVKLGAFVVAAGLAGLSGAMSATFTGFAAPTDYSPFLSITLLVAIVVGGIGSIPGTIVGAALLTLVTAYAPQFNLPPDLILGVVLLVVLIATPAGLAGLLRQLLRLVERLLGADRGAEGRSTGMRVLEPGHPAFAAVTVDEPELAAENKEHDGPVLLRIERLSAGYAEAKALSGISLVIPENSTTALVGSNGAGKTTLLRVISGLLRPTTGTIEYDGEDISSTAPDALARAGIAHVPEGRGIFPELTVRENLMSSAFSRPDRKVDIDGALTVFPALKDLLAQAGGSLSGGQQQMLAVGRALLTKPRLLLLDEPTLGLAPLTAKSLIASLEAIKDSGMSVLIVEQNARAALEYADRAYVMSGGEVVARGASAELLNGEILSNYLGVKA